MELAYTEKMERLHKLELQIALEIRRICEKHNIPYFLTAGTLLGAVRHGGFIPWDDDMDLGMLRENYERFLEVCPEELGEEYMLQTWDTDPNYPFSFAKIRLKGTHIVEGFSEYTDPEKNGLFVDIFPFDSVPDDPAQRKKQACAYFFCKRLLWIKKGMGVNMKKGSIKQKLKYYGFRVIAGMLSYDGILKHYKKIQTRYNHLKTEKVVTDGSYTYEKESLFRYWVTDLAQVSFEGDSFTSFREKEAYLAYFYGDYMKLPPVEKRNRHQTLDIDFGSY